MKAGFVLAVGVLVATGCTTVQVARLDRCTVQRTKSWTGATREEIVFCDRDAPQWSNDRALRLTQECLYEADINRRDAMILSARSGHPSTQITGNDDAFGHCYPDAVKSVQAENDSLKDQLKRNEAQHAQLDGQREKYEKQLTDERQQLQAQLDSQRNKLEDQLDTQREKLQAQMDSQRDKLQAQMDSQREKLEDHHGKLEAQLVGQHEKLEDQLIGQHGKLDAALASQNDKLQGTISKALERPVNAVAEARATSDSGSNLKHNSDSKELAHFDYGASLPTIQTVQATAPDAKPKRKHAAQKAESDQGQTCGKTCPPPAQSTATPAEGKPQQTSSEPAPMSSGH